MNQVPKTRRIPMKKT